MKFTSVLIFCMCFVPMPAFAQTSKPNSQIPRIVDLVKFDEWGDIPFSDEKARLDNAAIAMKKSFPGNIIYLLIYAGQTSCVGEAKYRGLRAKTYIVRRQGIKPNQVVWIDGGYQQDLTTEVWIWPPDVGRPSVFPEFNLDHSDITLEKNCKIKYRAVRH